MKIKNLKACDLNPQLYIDEKTYIELLQHVKSTDLEITFILHIEKENNNKYVVQNYYIPPQWNEPMETKTIDSEYPKWCFELVKSKVKLNGHGHTHPKFSTNPSGYDVNFFEDLIKDTKSYQFRLIMNQKGEINCDLIDKINGFAFYGIPVIVECEGFNLIVQQNLISLNAIDKNKIKIKDITESFSLILESNHILINATTKQIMPTNPINKEHLIKTKRKYQTNERTLAYSNHKNVQTSLYPTSDEEKFDGFDDYEYYSELRGLPYEY